MIHRSSDRLLAALPTAFLLLLAACASQPAAHKAESVSAATTSRLSCLLATNCVNSLDSSGLEPLRFVGTAEQAAAQLRATIAAFPEAQIVKSDATSIETIFTTRIGFRDRVEFVIDPQLHRIDYRSGSTFGLFDFGKNRSRMEAFAAKFEELKAR